MTVESFLPQNWQDQHHFFLEDEVSPHRHYPCSSIVIGRCFGDYDLWDLNRDYYFTLRNKSESNVFTPQGGTDQRSSGE